jgi:hypothetical protein
VFGFNGVRMNHPEQGILPSQSLQSLVHEHTQHAEQYEYDERQPKPAQKNKKNPEHEAAILPEVQDYNNENEPNGYAW